MASVTADFGPFAVLLKAQNTPLREYPVPLFAKLEPFLDKYEIRIMMSGLCETNEFEFVN